MFGKKHKKQSCIKMSINRSREKNWRWAGEIPKRYTTLHKRIWDKFGKADKCENKNCEGKTKMFHWSNKNHKYDSLDRKDWQMLCQTCHQLFDRRKGYVLAV